MAVKELVEHLLSEGYSKEGVIDFICNGEAKIKLGWDAPKEEVESLLKGGSDG